MKKRITLLTCLVAVLLFFGLYTTIASTNKGDFAPLATNVAREALTAFTVPYKCNFTKEEFNQFTVINVNEDRCYWWYNEDNGETRAQITRNISGPAKDWLISPSIALGSGVRYKLSYKIYKQKTNQTFLQVTMGKGITPEDQTHVLELLPTDELAETRSILLPDNLESGDYNIGFYANGWGNMAEIFNLSVVVYSDGNITGRVTDGATPIEGAEIKVKEADYKVYSNAQGEYQIKGIDAGDYTLITSKENYDSTFTNVTVKAFETINQDIILPIKTQFSVSGKVINAKGDPISNANVKLIGESNYEVLTLEDGTFEIPKVFTREYTLIVEKNLKITYSTTIKVGNENLKLDDITLDTRILNPQRIIAEPTKLATIVTWKMPLNEQEFRHDAGICEGQAGVSPSTEYAVLGSLYRTPALVSSMSWMTTSAGGPHNEINIFVFALDENGNPTNNILFSEKNVPNRDYQWETPDQYTWGNYIFPEPVEAPNGFMLAISTAGYASVATDNGVHEGYPDGGNSYLCFDYRYDKFECVAGNYFLRATGSPLGKPKAAPAKFTAVPTNNLQAGHPLLQNTFRKGTAPKQDYISPLASSGSVDLTYTAWRLADGEENTPENWVSLTEEPTKAMQLIDEEYPSLSQGRYKYAIQAIFEGETKSEIRFSNTLEKDFMTNLINVRISTNTPIGNASGALVTLLDEDANVVRTATVTSGRVEFLNIPKGNYDIQVELPGFKTYNSDLVAYTEKNTYDLNDQDITLELIPDDPFNLKVTKDEKSGDYVFEWNALEGIFEDFEGHEDFAVNSPGALGWSYIDGDGSPTTEINGLDEPYPHMGEVMAYMVFNPSKTKPMMIMEMKPHSGDKVLTSIKTSQTGNNDFLISPELNFTSSFVMKFFAKTGHYDLYGEEEMQIGYSVSGTNEDDFMWITPEVVHVPMEWKEYTYTFPAQAKYVTINCVSKNHFFFLLDDIYIGYEKPRNSQHAVYLVFMDGELVKITNDTKYTFKNLTQGKHTVGVQSLYQLFQYQEAMSKIISLDFDATTVGLEETKAETENEVKFYPNPAKDYLYINGKFDLLEVYDNTGKLVGTYQETDKINVAGWADGIYIAKVMNQQSVNVHKIKVIK